MALRTRLRAPLLSAILAAATLPATVMGGTWAAQMGASETVASQTPVDEPVAVPPVLGAEPPPPTPDAGVGDGSGPPEPGSSNETASSVAPKDLADLAGPSAWRVVLIIALGLPFLYWLTLWVRALVGRRVGPHQGLVVGKLIFYPGACLIAVMVMRELGFSLTPLLGAAGVLGIALGFASQNSVGNIVSGFFLVGEKPFVVGDIIQIGGTAGQVLSVGMLSVQLRTWDNRFIRVPNENLMKSEVTNLTRFPVRRVDIEVRVSYEEDLAHVQDVLLEAARAHPRSLMEPEPQTFFVAFGDTAVHLKLTVWGTQEDRRLLKHTLPALVKQMFDRHGIRMPYLRSARVGDLPSPGFDA